MSLMRYMPAVAALAVAALAGCGSGTDPVLIPIPDEIREADLVDVAGGSLTRPSAFDLITGQAVRTDQFSGWDFLFQIDGDGTALLWPRAAIIDDEGDDDAGLRNLDIEFEALREAPEGGYEVRDGVRVAQGDVLAARSRRDPAFGNVRCRRFAKLHVLAVDPAEGTMSFRYLVNPNCEKRKLVPGATE